MGIWKKINGKLRNFKNQDELFEAMKKRAPIPTKSKKGMGAINSASKDNYNSSQC